MDGEADRSAHQESAPGAHPRRVCPRLVEEARTRQKGFSDEGREALFLPEAGRGSRPQQQKTPSTMEGVVLKGAEADSSAQKPTPSPLLSTLCAEGCRDGQ